MLAYSNQFREVAIFTNALAIVMCVAQKQLPPSTIMHLIYYHRLNTGYN